MEGADKLIVVNEAVPIYVEDVGHGVHFQRVGGEFCTEEDETGELNDVMISETAGNECLLALLSML